MEQKTNRYRIGYAQPSFLEGMARVLDFGGTLEEYDIPDIDDLLEAHPPRLSSRKANAEAIRSYWIATGRYIRNAMGKFEAQEKDKLWPSSSITMI